MFDPIKSLDGSSDPIEYGLLTNNEACVMGEAVKQASGRFTKCAPTDIPEFITLRAQAAEATSKTPIPVQRIKETREYETTATAAVGAALVGSLVTLHTDAAQVTATTTGGVFKISSTDGANRVRGYFRR